ncbi:MAG TPA: WXG100 family type VII secretion target [Mycobacteriales bacterium]|nr:WXG100 family type VII secretion target [Mycobacteriales bacterium]
MSGRDMCYALPERERWESAQVDHYVWGDPAVIDALGRAHDTAGTDLGAIADSLAGMDVSGFWTGDAATAFTGLRDRVVPAVRGLGTMHQETATALGTWQRHLGVYQEDCRTAITTGQEGWRLYRTTSCGNPDAETKMTTGKNGITSAMTSRDGSARTCRTALEAAAGRAAAPAQSSGTSAPVPHQVSAVPGQVGTAPSGQEPVPAMGPFPTGQPWPYVDPANGRYVRPVPGPWAIGRQPWEYVDG